MKYFVSLSTATISTAAIAQVSKHWTPVSKIVGSYITFRGRRVARFFDTESEAMKFAGSILA